MITIIKSQSIVYKALYKHHTDCNYKVIISRIVENISTHLIPSITSEESIEDLVFAIGISAHNISVTIVGHSTKGNQITHQAEIHTEHD